MNTRQFSWVLALAATVACGSGNEPEGHDPSDAATPPASSSDAAQWADAAPEGREAGAAEARDAGAAEASASDAGTPQPDATPPRDAGPDASRDGGTADALVWPNAESRTNSDPWLVTHHDSIARLEPRVLVIDLESTPPERAMTLVDKHIKALAEASSFHKYKDPSAQPALVYQLVKIAHASKGARIDYGAWNTQAFADTNLQIKDPGDPTGPNLTLCGLFERGLINEVWCMASADPKCGETQEAKQVYDASGQRIANRFANASNGESITALGCKVTVRITDFNSGRGAGCHQHAMGHAWERYMDSNAVPQLAKQAKRFLNWDLNTRVGAPFNSFYGACNSNAAQLTDCIVWDSMIHVHSGPSAARAFDIADMSVGCGNAHFYANTTGTYSYDTNTPDPEVQSSCENYGLHNGADGKDLTTPYSNAMTDRYYGRSVRDCPAQQPACDDDCGGHGTAYLYQNFPGPGTKASNDDGTPMRNWWVYLFY